MKKLLGLITPFKKLSTGEKVFSTIILVVLILLLWRSSGSKYIPDPEDVLGAFPRLVFSKDIFYHFHKSLVFCFTCIGYSLLISLFFCYLSVLPLFTTLCQFLRKFRFLPSAGLSLLFMKLTGSIEGQMQWMMIFGITTWLVDSMIGVALSVTDDDIMYAKSLRLSSWQMMREILIYGKAAKLMECVISNFAMAWMLLAAIENIAKASGGIGVILAESSKYYKFEEVYAIQILILITGIFIDLVLNKLKGFLFPYNVLKN